MSSSEHRFGTCDVIASARMRGDQPSRVRAVAAIASTTGKAHLSIRVGDVLIYLEDRAAFEALIRAVRRAEALAERSSVRRRRRGSGGSFPGDGPPHRLSTDPASADSVG